MSAHVASMTGSGTHVHADIMLRDGTNPSANFYGAIVTAAGRLNVAYRNTAGLAVTNAPIPNGTTAS